MCLSAAKGWVVQPVTLGSIFACQHGGSLWGAGGYWGLGTSWSIAVCSGGEAVLHIAPLGQPAFGRAMAEPLPHWVLHASISLQGCGVTAHPLPCQPAHALLEPAAPTAITGLLLTHREAHKPQLRERTCCLGLQRRSLGWCLWVLTLWGWIATTAAEKHHSPRKC